MKKLYLLIVTASVSLTINAQTANPAPYCLPNMTATNAYIQSVSGPGVSQSSSTYNNVSYVFYNNTTPMPATVGQTLSMQIQTGGGGGQGNLFGYEIFVDVNHNNIFENPGEAYNGQTFGNQSGASFGAYFPVPDSAMYGVTRMRIVWNDGSKNPCVSNVNTLGEVEDYQVNIGGTFALSKTEPATGIGGTKATLNGTVNANFTSDATVSFEYGQTTNYTNATSFGNVSGMNATPVSKQITGLTTNTIYHYRVKSVNANGTSYGKDETFVTTDGTGVPTIAPVAFEISPNPSNGIFHISSKNGTQLTIHIFEITGRKVFDGTPDANGNVNTHLSSGVYLMSIQSEGKEYRTRISVQ